MHKKLQTKYQTRQYMLEEKYEIYYYNDTTLRDVASHSHNYYEFYFFLEGNVLMEISGISYSLKYGDMILIPPGMSHRAVIQNEDQPYRRFVFWVSTEYMDELEVLSPDYVYLIRHVANSRHFVYHYDVITFNTLQSKIYDLIEEIHSDRFGREAKMNLCVNDLILLVNRSVHEMEHPQRMTEDRGLYQNLILYIERHLDEDLTLERLANHFYVNKYHVSHVFKANTGISVHQYIMKKRLSACRTAILNNIGISEACLMYGFKDYSTFFRAFKKEFGMSPKEYREIFFQKQSEEKNKKTELRSGTEW